MASIEVMVTIGLSRETRDVVLDLPGVLRLNGPYGDRKYRVCWAPEPLKNGVGSSPITQLGDLMDMLEALEEET
jgi:hypothetical protein